MDDHPFQFQLGDVLRDRVTGFTGVCVCRSQWVSNCNTYGLKSRDLDDKGLPKDRQHFDEPMLERIESGVVQPVRETGGPTEAPGSTTDVG